MTAVRIIVHAVFTLIGLHLLSALSVGLAAPKALFAFLSAGWFCWLALATSASLHNSRAVVLGALVLSVLVHWPYQNMEAFARATAPIAVGVLFGQALRAGIRELGGDDAPAEPVRRDQ